MNRTRLRELKRKLLHDAELAPVWRFFLDHLGEDPAFIAEGDRAHDPFVEAVVAQVGLQLYGADGTVRDLILTSLPDQHFVHGGFTVGGRIGGVIYFADAQTGLVVVAERRPSIDVKYARFSGSPVRQPGKPSQN